MILTNPPFGGEEEKGIQGNFPEDRQTAETALLFLQLVMRKLRRVPSPGGIVPRAAVIVPDGTLFNDGVTKRLREDLLTHFNLHTVIRLPFGVFAPYAKSIKTNILFFDSSGPTQGVWFFEHKIPGNRRNYSKTKPVEYEDFDACQDWLQDRRSTDQGWYVAVEDIRRDGWNLDLKHPDGLEQLVHQSPEILLTRVETGLASIQRELAQVQANLVAQPTLRGEPKPIGDFADLVKRLWIPEPGTIVKSLGVKWWGERGLHR